MKKLMLIALAVSGLVCAQASADAVWTGASGTDDLWSNANNWLDLSVPAAGDNIVFSSAGSTSVTATLDSARTIGSLTFNVDSDFQITYNTANLLVLNGNLTVNAPGAHTYTIGMLTQTSNKSFVKIGTNTVWTIGDGHTVKTTVTDGNVNSQTYLGTYDLQKAGAGTLYINTCPSGDYTGLAVRALTLTDGTLDLGLATRKFVVINRLLGSGTITSPAGWGNGYYYRFELRQIQDDSFYGNITGGSTLVIRGTQTFTLAGTTGQFSSTGGVYLERGTVQLDDSVVNNPDRYNDNAYFYGSEGLAALRLIGNDSTLTTETIRGVRHPAYNNDSYRASGLLTVDVRHGSGADAELYLGDSNMLATDIGMVMFTGNDLGSTNTLAPASRVKLVSGVPTGMTQGAWGNAVVKNGVDEVDFAAYDAARGMVPLGNYPDRVTLIDSGTIGSHVLVSGQTAQTLTISPIIASLKIADDSNINLGGNMLTIAKDCIIKTGTASSITNGTINNTTGAGTNGTVVIYNEGDLTISADLQTTYGVTKAGAGKLTLSGAISSASNNRALNWLEGDLTYASPSNATMMYGPGQRGGQLIMNGNSTLTFDATPPSGISASSAAFYQPQFTGGTIINSGTVALVNGTTRLGSGPVQVNSGGALQLGASAYYNGGQINMNGGTLRMENQGYNPTQSYVNGTVIDFADGTTSTVSVGSVANVNWWYTMPTLTGSGTLLKLGNEGVVNRQLTFITETGASTFSGDIVIAEGGIRTYNASSWPANINSVTIMPGTNLAFGANTTVADDRFLGGGTLAMRSDWNPTLAGNRTMTAANVQFVPSGTLASQAGILTFKGGLTLTTTDRNSATVYNTFAFDVLHGTGISAQPVAGTDYDAMFISTLTNLGNADLSVSIAAKKNFLGNVLTLVLTGSTNLAGAALHSVTFNNTGFADITVDGTTTAGGNQGWVTISNISYPGDANRDGITDMSD
ncbi:MAG: beta strand repeat-containing protein, partial [Phycisphaerae bacterium]